jgi:hypothetical protein
VTKRARRRLLRILAGFVGSAGLAAAVVAVEPPIVGHAAGCTVFEIVPSPTMNSATGTSVIITGSGFGTSPLYGLNLYDAGAGTGSFNYDGAGSNQLTPVSDTEIDLTLTDGAYANGGGGYILSRDALALNISLDGASGCTFSPAYTWSTARGTPPPPPAVAATEADIATLQDTVVVAAAISMSLLTAIAMALMRR